MPDAIFRLLSQKEGFVSGEKLSHSLGISRAAVWKKVNALRAQGCLIEAVRSRGYRLVQTPELFADVLRARLAGSIWKRVETFDTVNSTNEIAMDAVKNRADVKAALFVADAQRKGRGRLGRLWFSPKGRNIHLSLLLRPDLPPRDSSMLTLIASLACAEAVRKTCGLAASIKWPNDLMVNERKLGGILTEMRSDPDRILFAVIGIGINVNMRKSDFPPDLKKTATSILIETGRTASRDDLIVGIAQAVEQWLAVLATGGRQRLLDAWRACSSTIGRQVSVQTGNETVLGEVQDIDENGLLVLRTAEGLVRKISTGDVTMLRKAD